MSMSVCLSAGSHNSKTTRPNFTDFLHVELWKLLWPWLGPPLTALRYVTYFRFCGRRHFVLWGQRVRIKHDVMCRRRSPGGGTSWMSDNYSVRSSSSECGNGGGRNLSSTIDLLMGRAPALQSSWTNRQQTTVDADYKHARSWVANKRKTCARSRRQKLREKPRCIGLMHCRMGLSNGLILRFFHTRAAVRHRIRRRMTPYHAVPDHSGVKELLWTIHTVRPDTTELDGRVASRRAV